MTRQRHATGLYQAGDSAVVQAGQEPGETSPLIVRVGNLQQDPLRFVTPLHGGCLVLPRTQHMLVTSSA
jgi:hypothetical protein